MSQAANVAPVLCCSAVHPARFFRLLWKHAAPLKPFISSMQKVRRWCAGTGVMRHHAGMDQIKTPGLLVKIKIAGGHWSLWMFIPTFLLKHVEGRWWMLLVHHLMSWVAWPICGRMRRLRTKTKAGIDNIALLCFSLTAVIHLGSMNQCTDSNLLKAGCFSHVSRQFVLFGLVLCCQAALFFIRPDVERQLQELCAEVSPKLRGVGQLVQVPLLQI